MRKIRAIFCHSTYPLATYLCFLKLVHDFAKKINNQPAIYLFIFLLASYTEDEDKNVLFTTVTDVISELFASAVYDRRPRLAVQCTVSINSTSGI